MPTRVLPLPTRLIPARLESSIVVVALIGDERG
jgi:hypothetical protein